MSWSYDVVSGSFDPTTVAGRTVSIPELPVSTAMQHRQYLGRRSRFIFAAYTFTGTSASIGTSAGFVNVGGNVRGLGRVAAVALVESFGASWTDTAILPTVSQATSGVYIAGVFTDTSLNLRAGGGGASSLNYSGASPPAPPSNPFTDTVLSTRDINGLEWSILSCYLADSIDLSAETSPALNVVNGGSPRLFWVPPTGVDRTVNVTMYRERIPESGYRYTTIILQPRLYHRVIADYELTVSGLTVSATTDPVAIASANDAASPVRYTTDREVSNQIFGPSPSWSYDQPGIYNPSLRTSGLWAGSSNATISTAHKLNGPIVVGEHPSVPPPPPSGSPIPFGIGE